jgi:2-aminoadipate transaminase
MESSHFFARRAAGLLAAAPASEPADMISFGSGDAFPDILPDMVDAATLALTRYRTETLQYAPRAGLRELREWLAEHLQADGVAVGVERLMVINGAKHGLDLLCRLLLDDGDAVVVTAPTYFTAIPILRSFGVRFVEIGQDAEGIDVSALEERLGQLEKPPKFIYDVPDFHNPTGITQTRRRREALLALAERHRILVIEDSPYRNIRFEGESEPSLLALDRSGLVLGLGTFSKLVAPGLRVGWVVAPPEILARLAQLKSDGGSSALNQRIILEYAKSGRLAGQIERARDTYRAHRDRMVTALRRDLPGVALTVPAGGYYVWLTLPGGLDGDTLTSRAAAAGVSIVAGSQFYAGPGAPHPSNQPSPRSHVRLAYSHAGLEQIDMGVHRFADAYRSLAG